MYSNIISSIFMSSVGTYVVLGLLILIIIAVVSIASTISKNRERRASQAKTEAKLGEKKDANYTYFELEKESDSNSDIDYSSGHQDVMRSDSKQTSIMLKPIKSRPRPPKKIKKVVEESGPKEKEKTFNKDHIYNDEVARKTGTISMYKDVEGLYRFKLITSANETIALSKAYTTRFACIRGIKLAINAGKYAEVADSTDTEYLQMLRVYIFEISRDLDNRFRYKLKTGTLQDIIVSSGYRSKFNCINGVKSARSVLEFHSLRDDTSKTFIANFDEEVKAIWQEEEKEKENTNEDSFVDADSLVAKEEIKASINY